MKSERCFRYLFLAILCLVTLSGLLAQEKQKLTLETMNDPTLHQAFVTPRDLVAR